VPHAVERLNAMARLNEESHHAAWRDSLKYTGAAGPLFFLLLTSFLLQNTPAAHGVAPALPPPDPPPPPPDSSGFGWEITH
jgi:hypothetical protein